MLLAIAFYAESVPLNQTLSLYGMCLRSDVRCDLRLLFLLPAFNEVAVVDMQRGQGHSVLITGFREQAAGRS